MTEALEHISVMGGRFGTKNERASIGVIVVRDSVRKRVVLDKLV